jgi:hypothetical protein
MRPLVLALLIIGCSSMPGSDGDGGTGGGSAGGGSSGGGSSGGGSAGGGSAGGGTADAGKPGKADGMLEPWDTVTPLPIPRANHCAAALHGRLVVAGGNYKPDGGTDFVTLDDVQAVTVAADGTLGSWEVIGHLPSPGISCVLAAQGDTLVLLGGLFTDNTQDGNVWTATLQGNGMLGNWTQVGLTPYGRRALGPVADFRGDTVRLTDGVLQGETDGGEQSVLATATLTGSNLSSWSLVPYWPIFRGQPLATFSTDALFVAGGYDSDAGVLTDTTGVLLSSGAVSTQQPLPAPRTFGAAVMADDWAFAIGGRINYLGGVAVDTVYSAQETDAGVLGPWTAQASMPAKRSNHQATVVGDWLFVTGGSNNAPGGDTVYRARVKHAVP